MEAEAVNSAAPITVKPRRQAAGKKYCYKCKADIAQNVADYCFDRPAKRIAGAVSGK